MNSPVIHDAEVRALVSLLKVATRIGRPMRDGVADPEQVSVTELRIVLVLGGEGGLAGHELAELMAMQPMNVSRALASLSKMGLVEMVDNQENRRRKPFHLTPSGRRKYDDMRIRMREVAEFMFDGFNETERKNVGKLLSKLDRRLVEWQSPPELHHVPRA